MYGRPNDMPHFTADQFVAYMARQNQVDPPAFGIRTDVLLTYVSHFALLDDWQFQEPQARLFPLPVLTGPAATVMRGPVGAPLAAATLEELKALGAQRIWVLGYAGSLDPRFQLGDVVVVDRALSDEGTSRHYHKDGWSAPAPSSLAAFPKDLPRGSLWTTDAIYRETPQKISHFRDLGCHLVDMETSCYFHVGASLGLQVGALMVVSDELFHPWNPGFGSPPVVAGVRRAYDLFRLLLTRASA